MTLTLLLWASLLAAPEDLAPRLETLRFHLERLDEWVVPGELDQEKRAKLEELKSALDAGAADEEAFNDLYRQMDEVRMWLWANAAARPQHNRETLRETPDAWILFDPAAPQLMQVRISKSDLAMSVGLGYTQWEFLPSDDRDIELAGGSIRLTSAGTINLKPFSPGYGAGGVLHLAGFPDAPGLALDITITLIGSEIVFDIAAPSDNVELEAVNWPKAIRVENMPEVVSVIPHMQGMLLPGDWPQDIHQRNLSNSRALYMPWWGQIRHGHGVMTILETDDDGGAAYDHPAGGPTVIRPRWYASMKRLRYLRTARYVFQQDATYVTMAKRYRRYARETGRFVSLAEKLVRTPALAEVIGRPVLHLGALYHFVPEASLFNKDRIEANHNLTTFDQLVEALRTCKANGIEDAYVHLDGWGYYGYDNGHPDVLPAGAEQGGWEGLRRFADTCEELGYLFAVHDQYRDFYYNAVSYDDRLAQLNGDGSRPYYSTWCGGPQTVLSPRFAPDYVRRNHDLFAQNGVNVRGAYLDVFSIVPLEESYQAAHPVTRSDCARYRRECFELLEARGYVVSSEEPTDYLTATIHLVHHAPYATYPNIGGGEARGIPVPLFNLVYHESILVPWEMGDDGGWGIPRGDAGWLHCLLNAGLPYAGPGTTGQALERVKEAAALAERLAHQEMVNHEFLSPDRRVQRATYADGTVVTVDLSKREYSITENSEVRQ